MIEEAIGTVNENHIVLLSPDGGKTLIPSQTDDMDGDDKWDELFTLVNLDAGHSKSYSLVAVNKDQVLLFNVRTNIHFVDKNDP